MVKLSKNLLFLMVFVLGISALATIILSAAGPTITIVTPTNGSIYSYNIPISITTEKNSTTCRYYMNSTSAVSLLNVTFNTTWGNSSAFTPADTGYGLWHNITFSCTNATNTSWTNTSPTVGFTYFKIDTTNPIVSFQSGYNFTTLSTSIWNWTFNFTDNNYNNCYIRYYKDTAMSSPVYVTGTVVNPTSGLNSRANCTLLFNPDSDPIKTVIANGQFIIEGYGNDTANHLAVTSTNFTGVAVKMYDSKYNMFTYRGANATASTETIAEFVANHFGYATIISKWNNTYGNYTTYSSSTPTINNDTVLKVGDAIYVYSSSDKWYIQPDYTPAVGNIAENITLTLNGSSKGTSWNQMGLFYNTTMNTTLYACNYNATNYLPSNCPSDRQNVTYVSWFNASGNSYVTCKRGFTICSGGANPNTVVLPEGQAVWVLPANNNIVLNRSTIT